MGKLQDLSARSCDGKPLHPFAKKVPMPKKTISKSHANQARIQHSALVRIVDKCMKYPNWRIPMHEWMLSTSDDEIASWGKAPAARGEVVWAGPYESVQSLPRGYKINFLGQRAQKLGVPQLLTDQILTKIDEQDPKSAIDIMFEYETQTHGTATLSVAMGEQEVCTKTLNGRADEVAPRLVNFLKAGGVQPDGKLNMNLVVAYDMKFGNNGIMNSLVHKQSGISAQLQNHAPITRAFKIFNSHLDHAATAKLSPATYNIYEYFDEGVDFRKILMLKQSNRLKIWSDKIANQVKQIQTEQRKSIISVPHKSVQQQASAKAKANLAKGKAMLEQHKRAQKESRTVSLE